MEKALLYQYAAACTRRGPEFSRLAHKALQLHRSGIALEIGTGPAPTLTERLSSKFKGVIIGTDIDGRSVTISHSSYRGRSPVGFVACAGEQLPFSSETFDLVLSVNSLHHWSSPTQVFEEIHRVLKPRGHALIADFRRGINRERLRLLERQYDSIILRYRLRKSVDESYIPSEVARIISDTRFRNHEIFALNAGMLVKLSR